MIINCGNYVGLRGINRKGANVCRMAFMHGREPAILGSNTKPKRKQIDPNYHEELFKKCGIELELECHC